LRYDTKKIPVYYAGIIASFRSLLNTTYVM
jgi:hypothetical protein